MNALDWLEIPAQDLARARAFYEAALGVSLREEIIGPNTLALFPYENGRGVGGCLIAGPQVPAPSTSGTLVYLPATPTIDAVLARVVAAGGSVLAPKFTLPGEMGSIAHIGDSEGNRVGLHAAA